MKKVMIIDDSQTDRYIARFMVQEYGLTSAIVEQSSAISALNYLRQCADDNEAFPEVIFLDIRMPEMDGFEFLSAYEDFPPHLIAGCYIVMLSSSIDPVDVERSMANNHVLQYICKPIDGAKISALREAVISRRVEK